MSKKIDIIRWLTSTAKSNEMLMIINKSVILILEKHTTLLIK